jgi:hypothetical protein
MMNAAIITFLAVLLTAMWGPAVALGVAMTALFVWLIWWMLNDTRSGQ